MPDSIARLLVRFTLFYFLTLPVFAGSSTKDVSKMDIAKSEVASEANPKRENGKKMGEWKISGINTIRFENWDTFLAKGTGLDNTYGFTADRLVLTLKYENDRTIFNAKINNVKFFNLPTAASSGTGQNYYTMSGKDRNHSKSYFRTLNFTFKKVGDKGVSATIGRFEFASGNEYKGDNKTVEWVKTNRVANRLLDVADFSLYQRSMNGILLTRDNGKFHMAGSVWMPSAGGFSSTAGDIIEDIKVTTLAGTFKYGQYIPNQEIQLFAYNFVDKRNIVGTRPDNTGKTSTAGIDVSVKNFGLTMIGAYDRPGTVTDTLLWVVIQRGDWFELSHNAYALAVEAGYRWKKIAWTPWLRLGHNESSGDKNATDGEHKTFFFMLPSVRAYAPSMPYNLMNNRDTFAQLILKPNQRFTIRTEYHRLRLSESADRWYSGMGAIQESGTSNGIAVRATGGSTDLGSSFDTFFGYTFSKQFTANLLVSRFQGGAVASSVFGEQKDNNLTYLEAVYTF